LVVAELRLAGFSAEESDIVIKRGAAEEWGVGMSSHGQNTARLLSNAEEIARRLNVEYQLSGAPG